LRELRGHCSVYADVDLKVVEVMCVSSSFSRVHEMLCSRYEKYEMFCTFGLIDEGKFVVRGVRKALCIVWCIAVCDECGNSDFRSRIALALKHGSPTFFSQRTTTVIVNWLAGRTCKNHGI
jgi:hypothetical protein